MRSVAQQYVIRSRRQRRLSRSRGEVPVQPDGAHRGLWSRSAPQIKEAGPRYAVTSLWHEILDDDRVNCKRVSSCYCALWVEGKLG